MLFSMDFQSAMETFAEAWVAASTGEQTQALALTARTKSPKKDSSGSGSGSPAHESSGGMASPKVAATVAAAAASTSSSSSSSSNNSSAEPPPPPSSTTAPPGAPPAGSGSTLNADGGHPLHSHLAPTSSSVAPGTTTSSNGATPHQHPAISVSQSLLAAAAAAAASNRSGTPRITVSTSLGASTVDRENGAGSVGNGARDSLSGRDSGLGLAPSSNTTSSVNNNNPSNGPSMPGERTILQSPVAAVAAAAAAMQDRKQDFDFSKVNAKSLPLHCVVESVSSLQTTLNFDARSPWKRRPNVETDSYVIIPAATPFCDIVTTALQRLGYSNEISNTARGSISIKNWKSLSLDAISDNPLVSVSDILGELTSVVTLKITILRSKPTQLAEIKDKLLKLLILQSHALLRSTGCPLDEIQLSQICRSPLQNTFPFGPEISEETRRSFDQWWSNQLAPQPNPIAHKILPFVNPQQPGDHLDFSSQSFSASLLGQSKRDVGLLVGGGVGAGVGAGGAADHIGGGTGVGVGIGAGGHHPGHHPLVGHPALQNIPSPYPNQKTRMRTSFDPEMELPKLQRWFQENPHPSRQQIQQYVVTLNALESRRGRKPLDVNNVVYWFKNARAAQKRAEMRQGMTNGFGTPGMMSLSQAGDYMKSSPSAPSEDIDALSQDEMDDELEDRPMSPQLPLSLTIHERNHPLTPTAVLGQTPIKQEPHLVSGGGDGGSVNSPPPSPHSNSNHGGGHSQTGSQTAAQNNNNGSTNNSTASNHGTSTGLSSSLNNNNSNHGNNESGNSESGGAGQDRSGGPKSNYSGERSNSPPRSSRSPASEDLDMDEPDVSNLDDYRTTPSPDSGKRQLPFPMNNPMLSHSIMYMSHYIPAMQGAAGMHLKGDFNPAGPHAAAVLGQGGLNLSFNSDERRKRNRTFIDPVTEVPKLEQWFSMNTHPSHTHILKYTEDLNRMPYRQKFPRLESKNVQFWFKNRRAKCKRLKMSLYDPAQLANLSEQAHLAALHDAPHLSGLHDASQMPSFHHGDRD